MISRAVSVAVVLCMAIYLAAACPSLCSCKWRAGKEAIDCSEKDLITFPEGMDPATQWLNFSGNNLQTLSREKFKNMGLSNLQRIYLARCRLQSIDDRAFHGLSNLVDLDLSENYLTLIPSETFQDYPLLMKLVISHNPISVIHREAFKYLPSLNILEISSCEIQLIEDGAFIGANTIEWLKLDGNKLTTMKGQNILPGALHGINLIRNNWQCDCHIIDLHTWLLNYSRILLDSEVMCSGPPRLTGQEIGSIDPSELACLPDVSPTTLYLEIGEGKNLTLLCKVNAVPEAHVSWLFQGQVLQNDTIIGPGLHFYYYVEEGTDDKRSELFIYNTNPEDNGTFVCLAENAAGRAQANYTIRIVLKEEAPAEDTAFPFEYMMAIYASIVVLGAALITIIIVSIRKCKRKKRRPCPKDRNKETALENSETNSKCSVIREDGEHIAEPIKVNGSIVLTEGNHEMVIFNTINTEDITSPLTVASCSTHFRSPPSARNYANEQNPDLINHTESVVKIKRRDGDGNDQNLSCLSSYKEAMENVIEGLEAMVPPPVIRQVHWKDMPQYPVRVGSRELCQHAVDVHLNPGCLIEQESYPIDYGLPKVMLRPQVPNEHYKTLPHSRNAKPLSAANPINRFSREAEFLSRTSQQPISFPHYCPPDVRYTVDGYPRPTPQEVLYVEGFPEGTYVPSPPEGYKSDGSISLPCCTSPAQIDANPTIAPKWPHCLPAGLLMPSHGKNKSRYANIAKKCIGGQTESHNEKSNSRQASLEKQNSESSSSGTSQAGQQAQEQQPPKQLHHHQPASVRHEPLTESPDEGYVGEATDGVEI